MGLTFSEALDLVKQGRKLHRTGWNGKDMFIFYVPGSTFNVNRQPLLSVYEHGTEVSYRDHIDIKFVDGSIGAWAASQADLLADDWEIYSEV